jgi:hypothetical protein
MLYNIVRKKSDTVAHVLSASPLNISFWQYLAGNNLVLWNNLVRRIALVQLPDSKDVFPLKFASKWSTYCSLYVPGID